MRILLCLLGLFILLLTGCAVAPAKLARLIKPSQDDDLRALISVVVSDPDSTAGKRALGHFIEQWKKAGCGKVGTLPALPSQTGLAYRITFQTLTSGAYPLDYFDDISPAADFEINRITHHRRSGVGVPLVALRENQRRQPIETFFPPEVIAWPLTAVAKPGKRQAGLQDVSIELLSPLLNDYIMMAGKRQPLAADFSVPWASTLARAGMLNQRSVLDMITPQPKREPRLYLMEPYDRNKEPLIMIHGLLSSPLAWAGVSNELWADETIRKRYQIWHYLYNTSAPALYSARILRKQLRDLRMMLDPSCHDLASRRVTLLTHSMGGIVGKALAVKPGDTFWKAAFKVPHDDLKLSASDRATLEDAFEWQPDPAVHRIIFIAVPHRGSDFADNLLGRIGHWITAPPQTFQAFYRRISKENMNVFTAAYEELGRGKLDSVDSLSPRQPTLHILASLPFAKGVTVHSIIGDRGKPGPLEVSSDGVVPYSSSHIEAAVSEKVVHAGHGAFHHPEAITEIQRILKLK